MTTLEKLKTYLGITNSDEDEKLAGILAGAIKFAKKYCGRNFEYNTYTETVRFYNGVGTVKETPVHSVESIYTLDEISLTFEKEDSGLIYVVERYTGDAIVRYVGGCTETPADLELAIWRLAEYFYLKPAGVSARDIPGGRLQFSTMQEILDVLEQYRRRRI